ncbi:MAG: nucleotide exchange factor GrpE [Proteobacteria bacterium]|nr:nucleotide exchange factor GrpE [Pseudomonadota bacterium]
MTDGEEKGAGKVLEPTEDVDAQGEKKPSEETLAVEERPLEKLTKGELLERLKEIERLPEKNLDLYLRAEAEIENIKKRNKKERDEWLKFANESLIKEMLPVLDNLEQAISHIENENALLALKDGVELTLKGLKDTLMKSGLETVKSEGEPFDPNYHEAVSEMEDDRVEKGKVLCELQRGYILNNRLIRPAKVVVSKGKS